MLSICKLNNFFYIFVHTTLKTTYEYMSTVQPNSIWPKRQKVL